MKRTNLMKELAKRARTAGLPFEMVRQGKGHEVWLFGTYQFTVPRHSEVNEHTARGILAEVDKEAAK